MSISPHNKTNVSNQSRSQQIKQGSQPHPMVYWISNLSLARSRQSKPLPLNHVSWHFLWPHSFLMCPANCDFVSQLHQYSNPSICLALNKANKVFFTISHGQLFVRLISHIITNNIYSLISPVFSKINFLPTTSQRQLMPFHLFVLTTRLTSRNIHFKQCSQSHRMAYNISNPSLCDDFNKQTIVSQPNVMANLSFALSVSWVCPAN